MHGVGGRRSRRAGEADVHDGVSLRGDDPRDRRAASARHPSPCTSASPPGAPRRALRSIAPALDASPDQNGFLRISREWSPGDQVELRFPMPIQVVRDYETEFPAAIKSYFAFEPAAVFTKRRLPYASVSLGPLLFALPIADQDANTPAPGAQWQYALDTAAGRNGADITVERSPMPPSGTGRWRPP